MKYKLCVAIVFTVLTGQALCMEAKDLAVESDGPPHEIPDDCSDAGFSDVTDMSEAMSDITTMSDMTTMTTTSMTTHAPGLKQAALGQMEQAGTQKQVEDMFKMQYLNIHAHHFADPVPVPAVAENPRLLAIDVEWLKLWDVFEEKWTKKPLRVSMVDKDGNIIFDHLIKDLNFMMADGRCRFRSPYYGYEAIICINRFIADNPSKQPSPMTKAMEEAKQMGKGLFSVPDDEDSIMNKHNISTYLKRYGARYDDVVNDTKAQLKEPNTFLIVAGGHEDRKLLDVTEYPYFDIQYLYPRRYEQGSRDRGRRQKLRDLAKQILEKDIQTTDKTGPDDINWKPRFLLGHSSVEDAQTTMKLLLYKMTYPIESTLRNAAKAKAWTPKLNIKGKTRPMDAETVREWLLLTQHMRYLVGIKLDKDDKTTWIRRERTHWGMTAVHKATCRMGRHTTLPRALQWMLDADVDVNMTDNHNYTPLHQAVRKGTKHQEECAMLLLAAGADKHAKNEDGQTPSDVARSMGWTDVADAIDAYIKPDSEIQ